MADRDAKRHAPRNSKSEEEVPLSTVDATTGQVAVYIDFDNIVMSRYDELHGREAFRNDAASAAQPKPPVRQRLSEARIDLGMILAYATSFGTVVISRAYADWSRPANRSYAQDTLRHSIDLVQLFPATGTKNGADIRLAIDATDDLAQYPNITHVLVVAGDSDYLALAQRCRRRGRTVIGVGADKSVGRYWESACDEFRFYDALVAVAISEDTPEGGPAAKEQAAPAGGVPNKSATLVIRALRLMQLGSTSDHVHPAALKSQMKRLDPAFDERALGFKSFGAYLRSMPQLLRLEADNSGGRVYPADALLPGVAGAQPIATQGTVRPKSAGTQPAGPGDSDSSPEVGRIRRALNLSPTRVLGGHAVDCALVALRTVWSRADAERTAMGVSATRRLAAALTAAGLADQVARQFTNVLLHLLPVWLRDDELALCPNSELLGLNDDDLREVFHIMLAARVKHRLHPETSTVDDLTTAVYGSEVVADNIRSNLGTGLRRPGLDAIRHAIGPLLIPAPVLWDVAKAFVTIPPETPVTSLEELVTALANPFRQLETDPETVPMHNVHETFVEAKLLRPIDRTFVTDRNDHLQPAQVVSAVLLTWARRCTLAGIRLSSNDPVAMDALYRLLLPDSFQIDSRRWLREAIDLHGAALAIK